MSTPCTAIRPTITAASSPLNETDAYRCAAPACRDTGDGPPARRVSAGHSDLSRERLDSGGDAVGPRGCRAAAGACEHRCGWEWHHHKRRTVCLFLAGDPRSIADDER